MTKTSAPPTSTTSQGFQQDYDVEVQLRNAASGNGPDGEAIELDFVELRRDKVHPNSLRTVMSTILNLRENILPEELIRRW